MVSEFTTSVKRQCHHFFVDIVMFHLPTKQSNIHCLANLKLEAQWAKSVSLTFHSVFRKLFRVPSICAFYQISVHLATQIQGRRFFQKSTNQKQEYPGLAKQFQRRIKCEKLRTDDGKSSHCICQGELKKGYNSKTCTSIHIVHVHFHQVAMKPACFINLY